MNNKEVYNRVFNPQEGYVRSQRKGAPIGMRANEWIDPFTKEGPEALLDNLINSGYPWHLLGKRLKAMDEQFKIVSDEYASIDDNLKIFSREIEFIKINYNELTNTIPQRINNVLNEQTVSLQNRWLLVSGSMLLALCGIILSITSNKTAFELIKDNSALLGILFILIAVFIIFITNRKSRNNKKKKIKLSPVL